MWDVSDQLNPQNSPRPGRHRLDDDYDDFDDFDEYSDYAEDYDEADYVEDYASADAAGADTEYANGQGAHADSGYGDHAATGATAAAAAATSSESGQAPTDGDVGDGAGDGRYMRILAIVLLIVGVCLVAYGAYALSTRGDDSDAAGDETSVSATENAPADGNAGSPGATASEDGNVAPPPPPAESGQPVAPPEASPEAAPAIDRKTIHVSVLNNSAVTGLADDVSATIGEQGWGAGETGNAPEDSMGVWERTTVYYDANNETEKAAAEQIASDNGWVAEPRDDRLRDAPAGIVVVATDPAA